MQKNWLLPKENFKHYIQNKLLAWNADCNDLKYSPTFQREDKYCQLLQIHQCDKNVSL